MTSYTWLFFDIDDTLFDYDAAESAALRGVFAEHSLPFTPRALAAYREINRTLWQDFEAGQVRSEELRWMRFDRLFQQLGLRASVEEVNPRYLTLLSENSRLFAGVEDLLARLAPRFHMGLITNGLSEVQRPRLARSPIRHFFEFLAISTEIGAAKPDPAFFAAALRLAGNPSPRSVLVIGDSLTSDIRGGIQSGLDTLWYNPHNLPPDPRWPATYNSSSLDGIASLLLGETD
jgi:2-haloacid dehalogenase